MKHLGKKCHNNSNLYTHNTIAHESLSILDPHQAILFPDFYIYHTLGSNPLYILFYVYEMLKMGLFFRKMLNFFEDTAKSSPVKLVLLSPVNVGCTFLCDPNIH